MWEGGFGVHEKVSEGMCEEDCWRMECVRDVRIDIGSGITL